MRRVTVELALMRDALDELRVNTTDDRDWRASFVRALIRELDALSTLPSVVADELRLRLDGAAPVPRVRRRRVPARRYRRRLRRARDVPGVRRARRRAAR